MSAAPIVTAEHELCRAVLKTFQPLVSDWVIAGLDRDEFRLLIRINPAERSSPGGEPAIVTTDSPVTKSGALETHGDDHDPKT